jgi:hypothetical protein
MASFESHARARALVLRAAVLSVVAAGVACERRSLPTGESGFFAFADAATSRPDPTVKQRPRLRKQAWYEVRIQGVPVGTAVAARNETGQIFPSSVALRLVHRIGASVVTSDLVIDATVGSTGEDLLATSYALTSGKDKLLSETTSGRRTRGFFVPEGIVDAPISDAARVLSLVPAVGVGDVGDPVPLEAMAFFRPGGELKGMTFNPLTSRALAPDGLTYDDDGFLRTGDLDWHGSLSLSFKRVADDDVLDAFASQILKAPVELAWFSNPATLASDARRLQADAQSCAAFARDAENQVRREFPQLPYLMHRRIFNFGRVCDEVAASLARASGQESLEKALDGVHRAFTGILLEDKQELPKALLLHPDAPLLGDPARRWQWVLAASRVLRGAHEELAGLIALERAQKVSLAVRVFIDTLTPGSVVKGVLRAKDVRFKTEVRTAQGNKAVATSWWKLPDALSRPLRLAGTARAAVKIDPSVSAMPPVSFELLHGQAFARGDALPVGTVCENYEGKVGLDLGDAPNAVIAGGFVRGVWDDAMRLSLVRDFAQRAGSHPACRQVIFSAPKALVPLVRQELEAFDKHILQNESEFQISNRHVRRMRVQPGVYELTLTSLVSGEVIGVREIVVPDGKPSLAVSVKFD